MPDVAINKVERGPATGLPVFEEIAKRVDAVRRRAFELFETRGREIGHALDDWLKAERELFGWPSAELKEKDGDYDLEVTLPGFEAKDVEVTASPGELVIHAAAEATKKKRVDKENVVWTEFGSNDVYRRFELPKQIDVEKVTANLDKGILRVKAPGAAKRKIVPEKSAA